MDVDLRFSMRSVLTLLLLSTLALPVAAELGSHMDSIAADAAHLKAQRRITANTRFATHEMTAASGTVVREYVSPAGTVFAVSWNGPYKPDLRQLMGQHYDEYLQQTQLHRARGPRHIESGNLVVEISGHARDFHGRAYLKDTVPTGVELKEIQ